VAYLAHLAEPTPSPAKPERARTPPIKPRGLPVTALGCRREARSLSSQLCLRYLNTAFIATTCLPSRFLGCVGPVLSLLR
jgi:hypothetical protein